MGRKPLPTAVKIQRGSFKNNPGRRNKAEPTPEVGIPKLPRILYGDKVAKAFWKATCETLHAMNVLTVADAAVIETYCLNESKLRAAIKDIEERGDIIPVNRLNPSNRIWAQCMDRRLKIQAELGLTPSSRTKLVANHPKETDILKEFLDTANSDN